MLIQTVPDNKYAVVVGEGMVLAKFEKEDIIFNSIVYMMAAYYVYDVAYPKGATVLFLFQDVLMDLTEEDPKRPTHYNSYASTLTREIRDN